VAEPSFIYTFIKRGSRDRSRRRSASHSDQLSLKLKPRLSLIIAGGRAAHGLLLGSTGPWGWHIFAMGTLKGERSEKPGD